MVNRPATETYFLVAGRNILIQACDDWAMQAVLQTFAGWFITSASEQSATAPDAILKIHCGVTPPTVPAGLYSFPIAHSGICATDSEKYYVEFQKSLIVFGPGGAKEVDLWVDAPLDFSSKLTGQLLSHALAPALRRCGVFEIHSAGVVAPGTNKVVLIAGPSGSGKSTLTTQLASCNWGYLSDDVLLLHSSENEIAVTPLRRFFALTADTIAAANLNLELADLSRQKGRIAPQELFHREPIVSGVPGIIIFPGIVDSDHSRLIPLTTAESMTRLLRLCPWAAYDRPTSTRHIELLGRLANRTSAFDLLAGKDILTKRERAAELIGQAATKSARAQ